MKIKRNWTDKEILDYKKFFNRYFAKTWKGEYTKKKGGCKKHGEIVIPIVYEQKTLSGIIIDATQDDTFVRVALIDDCKVVKTLTVPRDQITRRDLN